MKKVFLEIKDPCHQDWNSMTSTEKGAFCNSCAKNVYDFTNQSSNDIIQILKKEKNACGKFREDQLNRYYFYSNSTILSKTFKYLLSIILSLSSMKMVHAKTNQQKIQTVNNFDIATDSTKIDSIFEHIFLKVVNNQQLALQNIYIKLLDNDKNIIIETKTNSNGEINVKLESDKYDKIKYISFFNFLYKSKTIKFKNKDNQITAVLQRRKRKKNVLMGCLKF